MKQAGTTVEDEDGGMEGWEKRMEDVVAGVTCRWMGLRRAGHRPELDDDDQREVGGSWRQREGTRGKARTTYT